MFWYLNLTFTSQNSRKLHKSYSLSTFWCFTWKNNNIDIRKGWDQFGTEFREKNRRKTDIFKQFRRRLEIIPLGNPPYFCDIIISSYFKFLLIKISALSFSTTEIFHGTYGILSIHDMFMRRAPYISHNALQEF